jgi:hypothetical protein
MPDVLAHPPDLALAALVDRQLECVGGHARDPRGRCRPVVELDARAQRVQRVRPHRGARYDRAVRLVDLEARVRQVVGKLAVVGQQDQAGRVGVQTTDREEAQGPAEETDDGRAPLRVARRRDDPGGLVDRVDDSSDRTVADPGAVERDLVVGRNVPRRVEHLLTADPHPPRADDLLRGAP